MTKPTIERYDRDEDLIALTRERGGHHCRIYAFDAPEPVVVLGRGSRSEIELDLDACLADGVRLLGRRGGGCAVVLDAGNVVASAAYPHPGLGDIHRAMDRGVDWLLGGLVAMGISGVYRAGISDLVRGDRKIAGTCLYRARDLAFFSATLLVDPDLDGVERYLRHPPREPDYRGGRSHRAFMGRLVSDSSDAGALARALSAQLEGVGP